MYNLPFIGKIGESVDTDSLIDAIRRAVVAHPILNSVVVTDENGDIALSFDTDKPAEVKVISVDAEEMTVNTIKHGGKSVKSIDIMLCFTEEAALLRFRGNGAPFNPTDYSVDNEGYRFGEIEVMLKLTDSVNYMLMLDFNNTTLEIKR